VSKSPVIIVPYDATWPTSFDEIRRQVEEALGDLILAVEHIGSTAIPGLAAKPIIDAIAVLRDVDGQAAAIGLLEQIGYIHEGDLGIAGREAFHSPSGLPKHHLYLCEPANQSLRDQVAFRDYLVAHPKAASEYDALKRKLADEHRDDRQRYTDMKRDFVERILRSVAGTL
jgi:GrpB-like predicted nucleotidyltransferase (UPF0157 family)